MTPYKFTLPTIASLIHEFTNHGLILSMGIQFAEKQKAYKRYAIGTLITNA